MMVPTLTVLCGSPEAASQLEEPGLVDAVIDTVLEELGVLVPRLTVEHTATVSRDAIALRTGDTVHPAVPVDSAVPRALFRALVRHAASFVTDPVADAMLTLLSDTQPDLVAEVRAVVPLPGLAECLRRLVAERVSIRDLRSVCEGLVAPSWAMTVDDSLVQLGPTVGGFSPVARDQGVHRRLECDERVAMLRIWLRRVITAPLASDGLLRVALVDPAIERDLVNDRPLDRDAIIAAVRRALATQGDTWLIPILTVPRARPRLRELVRDALPDTLVLSYRELDSALSILQVASVQRRSAR